MSGPEPNFAREAKMAKLLFGDLSNSAILVLKELLQRNGISVIRGDVKYIEGGWYVSHSGLLNLAQRRRCAGIDVGPVLQSCDPSSSRWVFKATVFKSRACRGFVGYGDA